MYQATTVDNYAYIIMLLAESQQDALRMQSAKIQRVQWHIGE